MERVKDLGYANGWPSTPPLDYLAHIQGLQAGEFHDVETVQTGRCVSTSTCKTCGIRWSIDSGD